MWKWSSKLAGLALFLSAPIVAEEGGFMRPLELTLDGQSVAMTPAAHRDDTEVWVPLAEFCEAAGAVLKDLDGSGRLGVCDEEDGDVCVMLG